MTKYNSFHDGFTRGMLRMVYNLGELVEYLETESELESREEFIDELKRTVNDVLVAEIASKRLGLTQEVYDVLINKNKLITTSTKFKLVGNLMDYED